MTIIKVLDSQGTLWFRTEETEWYKNEDTVEEKHILKINDKKIPDKEKPKVNPGRYAHVRKTVLQFSLEEKYLGTFESLTQAAKKTGIPVNSISRTCRNLQQKGGGFLWFFE